jgi:biopolymer transport protein ExbB
MTSITHRLFSSTLFISLHVMLWVCGAAHAEDWAHKKRLSFDTTASGSELKADVSQLPLLLRLHSGNFTFSEAKPDGTDLRFFAADGKTALSYHIENFDPDNELANVWVSVPKLSANSQADAIIVAWGNPKAPSAVSAKATYDATQLLVQHFSQDFKDATSNANHGVSGGVKTAPNGPVGESGIFDGNAKLAVEKSATLKFPSGASLTLSTWVKPSGNDNANLIQIGEGKTSLTWGLANGVMFIASGKEQSKASAALSAGAWQHLAVVLDAGKADFYLNGSPVGGGGFSSSETSGNTTIGEGLRGELDELTVSGSARSVDYIKALYASQEADSLLMSFSEAAADAGGDSVIGILLGAVTLDGWIVIGLLMVMAVVSFYVMLTKAVILSSNNKANKLFLDAFKSSWDVLLTPGSSEIDQMAANKKLKKSSIYRLYAIGVQEVKQRFDQQVASGKKFQLSEVSLNSVRAALDAAMMRETQKLNSGIVLLTIAIAGGPFLGLLGTVVGVMITFAAIAAAGDVNVNAIAPGIAAALVATVAGLAVAIPALFGYNWLASQIKNASNDGAVFLDEFITKSAEMHSA